MGQVVCGAKFPWGEMSVGRAARGASCPWGELSLGQVVVGQVVVGRVFMGRVLMGRVVWEPGLEWGTFEFVFLSPTKDD
jgi:hypothetical protein